jgi:hypothetical protein
MLCWGMQSPQEQLQAEQALRPFGLSTEYVPHCKVSRQQQQHQQQMVLLLGLEGWCLSAMCAAGELCSVSTECHTAR